MIDYHSLFAWIHVLQPKSLKGFSTKRMSFLPEKRLTELFRIFLSRKSPIIKYYVTPMTLKRIEKMELDSLDLSSLYFLGERFYKECGLFFFDSKVHCLYTITGNSVILFVMQGGGMKKGSTIKYTDDSPFLPLKQKLLSSQEHIFDRALIGTAVIPFSQTEITMTINNDIFLTWFSLRMSAENNSYDFLRDYFDVETLKRLSKVMEYVGTTPTGKQKIIELNQKKFVRSFSDSPEYRGILHDYSYKSRILKECINTFIFLKTAKVVDETFIPFDGGREREYKKSDYGSKGVIKVDSFYNTNINVIAPFMVRGHFRNQPKKVDGIWTREPIYIDTFMKNGYHRRAIIDRSETVNKMNRDE